MSLMEIILSKSAQSLFRQGQPHGSGYTHPRTFQVPNGLNTL